MTIVSYM